MRFGAALAALHEAIWAALGERRCKSQLRLTSLTTELSPSLVRMFNSALGIFASAWHREPCSYLGSARGNVAATLAEADKLNHGVSLRSLGCLIAPCHL